MLAISKVLKNEQETQHLGGCLAQVIDAPLVLSFRGDLGAGKSTLVRAMLRALGVTGSIKSPTFSLVESYLRPNNQWLHHFDLYRIEDDTELDLIGFRDYFSSSTVCCIEWPERAGSQLPAIDVDFSLTLQTSGRLLEILAYSESGHAVVTHLTTAR